MPRLSIILTDEQSNKMDKYLPWGTKQAAISSLIDMMNEAIELHGPKLIGFLINGQYNLLTQEIKDDNRRHTGSSNRTVDGGVGTVIERHKT
jgi:hypothetical protein